MIDEFEASLDPFIRSVLGKKAVDVVALDLRELTSIADVFIICSGRSNRQVSAIAEHVEHDLRKHKIKPLSVEGAREGQWVLMDYGHVIIHVFHESARQFYDLEGFWADARRVVPPALARHRAAAALRERAAVDDD
jgi:ribosome-associated protein